MGIALTEFGSDFNLCTEEKWLCNDQLFFKSVASQFFLSGRSALCSLIEFGIQQHNWKKIYIPSFYCHEVTDYIKELPIKIEIYPYNPDRNNSVNITDETSKAVVKVDYFGLGISDNIHINNINTYIIEDVTHNIQSIKHSTAHYGFASLRKELPVPTGGVVFSNRFTELPIGKFSFKANYIAQKKLTAMHLKTLFLQNKFLDKSFFRSLFLTAEESLELKLGKAQNPEISNAVINNLQIQKILSAKQKNLEVVLNTIKPNDNFTILNKKKFGFGLLLKAKTQEHRDSLKKYLIKNAIYPAVLWPNQIRDEDVALEDTMIFLHTDFRYNTTQMISMCNTINLHFNN